MKMTNKRDVLLAKIQEIKHDLSELVPVTIELMFDACLGVLYEDFVTKMAEFDARDQARAEGFSSHLGLLRAKAEGDLKRNKAFILYLKERVTRIYSETKNESEKNKEKGGEGPRQPDSPGAAPPGSEGGSGGG